MFPETQSSSSVKSICVNASVLYISLCVGNCLVCRHTRQLPMQSDIYKTEALTQIDFPDDEDWVSRNMYRKEIKTLKKVRQFGY
jgi:hypothetical protein